MKAFRIVAFLEGISFLLLLGIAVPLKHIYGYEHATQEVGMAHGVLFMAYIALLYFEQNKRNWDWKTSVLLFIAALLPFGTFVADWKILRSMS
jgi:integral membrane protein